MTDQPDKEHTALDDLAHGFDQIRPRLIRVAYAMVGSRAEAEDVVADTWLRLANAHDRGSIDDVEGWCVVAVSRRAMNVLRSARVQREAYTGPWLPEPLIATLPDNGPDPADRVTLDESLQYALLVVLETLSPAERTAWVLHDVFGMPFPEIADVVGRTPGAVRQLAARARRHVRAGKPRVQVDRDAQENVLRAFLHASRTGDLETLIGMLDHSVTLTSDGAGEVTAARRPVVGADKVARFFLGVAERYGPQHHFTLIDVNGAPGLAITHDGHPTAVLSLTVDEGIIQRIDMVLAPNKLPDVFPTGPPLD